jgi:hypothetical protein
MAKQAQPGSQSLDLAHLPIPGGDQAGTKWLIGAVLAAGQNGCECTSCKLLKKFGGAMSQALIKEDEDGGDKGT